MSNHRENPSSTGTKTSSATTSAALGTSHVQIPSDARQRTLGQSWLAIPRKTRMVLSCALFGTAATGLWFSDKLEILVPAEQSTSQEQPSAKT